MIKSIQFSIILLLGCMYQTLAQENTIPLQASKITVEISGVASDEGALFVAMYTDENNWLKSTDYSSKSIIENGKSTVIFNEVPAGNYAISIYHDANGNGELDTNWIGIPKEEFACSNDAKAQFGPPKWSDAVFQVDGTDMTQVIKF